MQLHKRYINTSHGQIHALDSGVQAGAVPLYCLHATAYSGQTFLPLMHSFAARRRLVALDAPGYGASQRPESIGPLERYAQSIGEAIRASGEQRVDVLGYHTGAFFATELAAQQPELIRRLILIGVPYYTGEERAERLRTLARPQQLTERLAQFKERWDFFVASRPAGQSLERGFANFIDELRAWPHGWWAHHAAFTYEPTARLALLRQPVLILNPQNHLSEPSRRAARLIPGATLIELPHLSHAIFDLASEELAGWMRRFLDHGRC